MADARDLKSLFVKTECGFESRRRHFGFDCKLCFFGSNFRRLFSVDYWLRWDFPKKMCKSLLLVVEFRVSIFCYSNCSGSISSGDLRRACRSVAESTDQLEIFIPHQPGNPDADFIKDIHRTSHEEEGEDVGCWSDERCQDENNNDRKRAGAA
jgi:hypothetical protein